MAIKLKKKKKYKLIVLGLWQKWNKDVLEMGSLLPYNTHKFATEIMPRGSIHDLTDQPHNTDSRRLIWKRK